jgi:hypothetical protein
MHPTLRLPATFLRVPLVMMALLPSCGDGPADPRRPVTSVELSPGAATLPVGATFQFTVKVKDASGRRLTGREVTWTVSNGSVASITTEGILTGVSMGAAQVEAEVEAIADSAGVTVLERATSDRPDDSTGSQAHVFYVLPEGGTDRRLDVEGPIRNTLGSVQSWLAGQTGGRRLRIDTAGGLPDVTFVALDLSEAEMASRIEAEARRASDVLGAVLAEAELTSPEELAIVYYDGTDPRSGHCYEPVEGSTVLVVGFLQSCNSRNFADSPEDPMGILEIRMIHDLLHALGYVGEGAPHETKGHVDDDPMDLLHIDGPNLGTTLLDVGHDDYFGENVPAGVLNFAESPYLTP